MLNVNVTLTPSVHNYSPHYAATHTRNKQTNNKFIDLSITIGGQNSFQLQKFQKSHHDVTAHSIRGSGCEPAWKVKGKRNYKYGCRPEAVPSVQPSCERTIAIATRENEIQKNVSDAAFFPVAVVFGGLRGKHFNVARLKWLSERCAYSYANHSDILHWETGKNLDCV